MRATLERIAALIHRESGMVIREVQYDALAATLARVDPRHGPDVFLRRLLDPVSGAQRLAKLVDEITVKETFFLRHAEQLGEIDWFDLLQGARTNGSEKVRVWSAACATGEEAYSLALLACEAFGTLEPPVEILATDISAAALQRAEAGEYGPRSVRELHPTQRARHFEAAGDRLIAGSHLRALVTFARHNLVAEPAPPLGFSLFELILCRNVLIYFDGETIDGVASSLESALAPSGALVLGAADALSRGATRLRTICAKPPLAESAVPARRVLRRPLGRRPALERPAVAAARTSTPAPGNETPTEDFLRGLADLEASNPSAAVAALRRALYSNPNLGVAAFQLGRAYESLGNPNAARRAYEQALRTFGTDADEREEHLLEQVSVDDVRTAIAARIDALRGNRLPDVVSPGGR